MIGKTLEIIKFISAAKVVRDSYISPGERYILLSPGDYDKFMKIVNMPTDAKEESE